MINKDSPTEYFSFVLCLCLIPWEFIKNPEQHTIVRLRMNRNTISFVEYEKCDYERARGKKRICMMAWQQENAETVQVQERLQMKTRNENWGSRDLFS